MTGAVLTGCGNTSTGAGPNVVAPSQGEGAPRPSEQATPTGVEPSVSASVLAAGPDAGAGAEPYAWINGPYVAKVGRTLSLDGSGSYSPTGSLVRYQWDLNGDGTYDETTTSAQLTHRFTAEYSGSIALRVSDDAGHSAVATTHLGITDDGDETPREEDNCPDIDNQGQEDYDSDGLGDVCDATPGWGTEDQPGVIE